MSEKPPYKTQDDKWIAIDDYIAENFLDEDPALDATLAASEAASLPEIQVAPLQGKLLMLLAASLGGADHPRDRHTWRL